MVPAKIDFKQPRELKVKVRLATAQFGGGVEARVVDETQWLRGPSVRGALRFWWRALYGGKFDIKGIRDAEEKIFGSAAQKDRAGPGALAVTVECERATAETNGFEPPHGSPLGVAYFPGAKNNQDAAARLLKPGKAVCATIRLSSLSLSEQQWEQVRLALAVWVVFGGSGSRTRRAAGAIVVDSEGEAKKIGVPFDRPSLMEWLKKLPKNSPIEGPPKFFRFDLWQQIWLTRAEFGNAEGAQTALLDLWREFRQDRVHPPSWDGPNGWGQTKWPEADGLRFLFNTHARWFDETEHRPKEQNRDKAPRAHLGLPIGIKFKDDRVRTRHHDRGELIVADPPKAEIVHPKSDRYASPVLLCVSQVGNDKYIGIIIITPSQLLDGSQVAVTNRPQQLDVGRWQEVVAKLANKIDSSNKFELVPTGANE